MQCRYVSGLKIFANTWRNTGTPLLLQRTAASMFGAVVGFKLFRHTPGRAIRTRWKSLTSIQRIAIDCALYAGRVFAQALDARSMEKERKAKADKEARSRFLNNLTNGCKTTVAV